MYCPTCDKSFSAHEVTCPSDGTALVGLAVAAPASMAGRVLNGRYRLTGQLGSGGMGVVYRATQLDLDREVAIKLIRSEFAQKPDTVKRFLRESRICGKLSNPHIVNVQEMGRSEEGELFLAMELLRGNSLDHMIKKSGSIPVERAAWIVSQVCEALVAAHAMDVVHRDLKPQNIMVLDNPPGRDFVKVLDFGLAKSLAADSSVTQSGSIVGTPLYMPPEMLLDGKVDARSDQYSLGVIFYQLVTGALPFTSDTIPGLLLKQAHADPDPLPDHVPEPVRAVIMRLLSKKPEGRYETATAARAAIASAVGLGEESFDSFPVARARGQARSRVESPDSENVLAVASAPEATRRVPRAALWIAAVAALGAVLALVVVGGNDAAPGDSAGAVAGAVAVSEAPTRPGIETPSATTARVAAHSPDASPSGSAVMPQDPPPDAKLDAVVANVELRFESSPSATLLIDGKAVGRTPQTLQLPVSDAGLDVVLRRKGYQSVTMQVTPSKDQTFDKRLKRVRKTQPSSGAHDSNLPF